MSSLHTGSPDDHGVDDSGSSISCDGVLDGCGVAGGGGDGAAVPPPPESVVDSPPSPQESSTLSLSPTHSVENTATLSPMHSPAVGSSGDEALVILKVIFKE